MKEYYFHCIMLVRDLNFCYEVFSKITNHYYGYTIHILVVLV